MRKRIHLNAFSMNCVSHIQHGLWVRDDTRQREFNRIEPWIELARLLEMGGFDALFLADVIGTYDLYRGGPETAIVEAVQIPANDPMPLIPAMAMATEHLGFAFTSSVLQVPPFTFARQISTLDHLTQGRIAWNIVTSYLPNAGTNLGLGGLPPHDERYRRAEEYLEVTYKLWEGSWEEDAVLCDTARGVYADPAKIHTIDHAGDYYEVEGPHLSEPSPQRTPLLFQAGSSDRGREFAATHAECVFMFASMRSLKTSAGVVQDIRARAARRGRQPEDILFFQGVTPVVGGTEAEAKAKAADYLAQSSVDGRPRAHERQRGRGPRRDRSRRAAGKPRDRRHSGRRKRFDRVCARQVAHLPRSRALPRLRPVPHRDARTNRRHVPDLARGGRGRLQHRLRGHPRHVRGLHRRRGAGAPPARAGAIGLRAGHAPRETLRPCAPAGAAPRRGLSTLERKDPMDADELRSLQAPLKERYREDTDAALIVLKASGAVDDSEIACSVDTGKALVEAGLHPSGGGTGLQACSGDMLLQALVACAGVTLKAVATALSIDIQGARVSAEGDLDVRGTLGVDRDAPVGFRAIRLHFELASDAAPEDLDKLYKLTERYCVVYQTLTGGAPVTISRSDSAASA